jgi:hypothetical protein
VAHPPANIAIAHMRKAAERATDALIPSHRLRRCCQEKILGIDNCIPYRDVVTDGLFGRRDVGRDVGRVAKPLDVDRALFFGAGQGSPLFRHTFAIALE